MGKASAQVEDLKKNAAGQVSEVLDKQGKKLSDKASDLLKKL